MKKSILAAAIAALVAGCAATVPTQQATPAKPDPVYQADFISAERDRELLAYYLEGTWDTIPQEQLYGDSTPMRLRIARIWPQRTGEIWFYTETVDPANESKAMRQRIVRLDREGLIMYAYDFRVPGDPASHVGEWRKEQPFAGISPESLVAYAGCRARWVKQADTTYAGGTDGQDCQGDGSAGTHEHAEYYMGSTSIRGWIQIQDRSGRQVGGLSSPSEFRKVAQKAR